MGLADERGYKLSPWILSSLKRGKHIQACENIAVV
jgi:hypothetical protein